MLTKFKYLKKSNYYSTGVCPNKLHVLDSDRTIL